MKNYHLKSRRGGSMVYLGISVVLFVAVYGVTFYVAATILGAFGSAIAGVPISDPAWATMNTSTQKEIQLLVPLMPALGTFILVLKVFTAATVRGAD